MQLTVVSGLTAALVCLARTVLAFTPDLLLACCWLAMMELSWAALNWSKEPAWGHRSKVATPRASQGGAGCRGVVPALPPSRPSTNAVPGTSSSPTVTTGVEGLPSSMRLPLTMLSPATQGRGRSGQALGTPPGLGTQSLKYTQPTGKASLSGLKQNLGSISPWLVQLGWQAPAGQPLIGARPHCG